MCISFYRNNLSYWGNDLSVACFHEGLFLKEVSIQTSVTHLVLMCPMNTLFLSCHRSAETAPASMAIMKFKGQQIVLHSRSQEATLQFEPWV